MAEDANYSMFYSKYKQATNDAQGSSFFMGVGFFMRQVHINNNTSQIVANIFLYLSNLSSTSGNTYSNPVYNVLCYINLLCVTSSGHHRDRQQKAGS